MKMKQFCKFFIAIPLSNFYQVGRVHGQNVDVVQCCADGSSLLCQAKLLFANLCRAYFSGLAFEKNTDDFALIENYHSSCSPCLSSRILITF